MAHGHVCLAVNLQHEIFSTFLQKNPRTALFCALVITDLALMIPSLALLLYGTFFFFHCPFASYFQMFLWFHIVAHLSWIFQYCRTCPAILNT